MNIGINASFLRKPGTGIGQVSFNFLRMLSASEYAARHTFFLYLEQDEDLSFLPVNFHKRIFLPWWRRDDMPRRYLWEKAVAHRAAHDRCDVLLSLGQSATFVSGMKHVMVVHDIIPSLFPEYREKLMQKIYVRSVERAIQSADQLIAVSQSTKNDLMEYFHIPEEIITIAQPDVSPLFRSVASDESVQRVLAKYGLERGYIYHGGGLEIRKNSDRLIRAYAALAEKEKWKELPVPLPPLVVSGQIFAQSNPLATNVVGLVRELGLEDRVKLLGFVPEEDLPALYRGALFFAYPSHYEGFGIPVLEALSQGVPVLASDSSSLQEVGGEAALYVDPESDVAIVEGMERLLTVPELRRVMISNCEAQLERFSWERFVENIFTVIQRSV